MPNVIEVIIKGTDQASDVIAGIGNAMKGTAILAFAQQAGQAALELAKLGQQSLLVEARLAAFSGSAQNAEATINAIAAATGGTISRMEAAAGATRLFQMGLVNTADEAANVVLIASRLGDQTMSTGDRVADFAALLANQSIPRLDNFGISSARVRTRITELQAQIPGLTRETAFMQAVMSEASTALATVGESAGAATRGTERLAASLSDLKVGLGEALAPTLNVVAERLSYVTGGMAGYFGAVSDATQGMNMAEAAATVYGAGLRGLGVNMGGTRDTAWEMTDVLSRSTAQLGQQIVEMGDSATVFEQYNAALGKQQAEATAASNAQVILALANTNSADSVNQYNFAIQAQAQAATAAQTAQRELEASTRAAALAATEAKSAFIDAAAGIQEMSQASFAQAQLQALKQEQEDGRLSLEQYTAAQQSVLLQFGVLTQAEMAAQQKVENLSAAFIAGRLSPEEYAAALLGVKEKVDVAATSVNTLAAAQSNANATLVAGASAGASEIEALGLLTGQAALTAATLDSYALSNDAAAGAAGRVAEVAGAQSGALGNMATSADTAAAALERAQARIDALQDKTVTVTVKQQVEASMGGLQQSGLSEAEAASIMGSYGGMSGMAAGFSGVFAGPTARLFGESGPEVVRAVPLQKVMQENYNITYNAAPSFGNVQQDIAFAKARRGR